MTLAIIKKVISKTILPILGLNTFPRNVLRVSNSKIVEFSSPIVITNNDFRFIVKEQIEKVKVRLSSILIEPSSKNTAPAILAAALHAKDLFDDPIILILPSDHLITDLDAFHKNIFKGIVDAEKGKIVTFGVKPVKPETAYGYIELYNLKMKVVKPKKFIEKPTKEKLNLCWKLEIIFGILVYLCFVLLQ